MRPAATLYARIVGWLLLNLAILAVGFQIFFADRFTIEPRMQMAGEAGDKIIAFAREVIAELSQSDREGWDEILQRHGNENSIDLHLFRSNGTLLAGPQVAIPDEVRNIIRQHGFAASDLDTKNFLFNPHSDTPPPPEDMKRPQQVRPVTMIINPEDSNQWWFGVQLPIFDQQPGINYHVFLFASSEGLSPTFFDVRPRWPLALTAIGISILLWIPMVRHITRPIQDITAATEMIADGQFDVTVQSNRSDELGRLGEAINKMSSHLEGFISGQKRFLGDTAHELCSPLARMQMAVGILETKATAEQKDYVSDISEEVQHMSDLVNELLSFSKASLQPAEIKIQNVNIKSIVEMAVKRETQGKANIKVNVPDDVTAMANTQLLARAVGNLLRNAVRYAAHAGPIGIKAERRDQFTFLVVWDSGPGISNDHLGMIFDPFYRPDASRTSTTGGVGLGMAIVKTCIESCGGRVICKNRRSQGLKIIIRLNAETDNQATGLSHAEFDLPGTD